MPSNRIEKIAKRFAVGLKGGEEVHSGDYLTIAPAYVMTHDNTGAVIPKFEAIGAKRLADPRRVVITLDHNIQDKGAENLEKYARIEAFARRMGADFHPAGRGIGHQVMCEEGYVVPGTLVVASDSHANMYGGLGALGTPVVRTDAAAIWATGETWWQVPPVARVELRGRLRPGVTGKDVIITLCGFFCNDEVLNHAIEFTGEGVAALPIEARLTIANMTTEWGALAGVFPCDAATRRWFAERIAAIEARGEEHPRLDAALLEALATCEESVAPDPDAVYAKELVLDLDRIVPHVAGPDSVKVITPLSDFERHEVRIDKAYLVSCVNSRVGDLAEAARVVRGKRVAPHVSFYVAAASSEVEAESRRRGDWEALLAAGAIPLPPGCGPCIGLGTGLLEKGEVGISATNRNFKGRMGSKEAKAYLASPAVVAASAIAGRITGPSPLPPEGPPGRLIEKTPPPAAPREVEILPGFPEVVTGELLFCPRDNLNTDGIYPGKYTYIDDFTPAQQAAVAMENYDPHFQELVEPGDILVGGFNFGTGSSREQAATALKHRGIRLVIAGSFSETYKRNALNNGFLVLEVPSLVRDLKEAFGTDRLTVRTGWNATIDFKRSRLTVGERSHPLPAVGRAAQELIVAGGLEAWVKGKVNDGEDDLPKDR